MKNLAWVITVNMGYGHQRTAFALKDLGRIINANDYEDIPPRDRKIWETARKFYETVSRISTIPFLGDKIFSLYDRFQRILEFYPRRDLSRPNLNSKSVYSLIKKGWGKDLVQKLSLKNREIGNNLPLVSTFFVPAFMAEFFGYRGEIFCVVCDADISRAWAPFNPKDSRIKYFAPTERVVERLLLYGVRKDNIFFTGYPLPKENIGGEKIDIVREDLKNRLVRLDPKGTYQKKYSILLKQIFDTVPKNNLSPLTIMFAVGGAGAQREIGVGIVSQLQKEIQRGKVKVILSAGIKKFVKDYFEYHIKKLGLSDCKNVTLLFSKNIHEYFSDFNNALRETDILWTKPSELCFYSALGIPIIIAPPLGSQEKSNKRWLLKSGFGIVQENLNYVNEWLFDWLDRGYLAEAAVEGFIEGEKLGVYRIERVVKNCLS